jgi:hypothetical protein
VAASGAGASGGNATVVGKVTGAATAAVTGYGYAQAGNSSGYGGEAGAASVKIAVTGAATTATAIANGSDGAFGGGNASASANATGTSGTTTATAQTNDSTGVVLHEDANAAAPVSGGTKSVAVADIGNESGLTTGTVQSQAEIFGMPDQSVAMGIVDSYHNLPMYLGVPASPTFVALAYLGGAHSGTGTASQTSDSSVNIQLSLSSAELAHDTLELGLFGGAASGTSITGVVFDLLVNGTPIVDNMSFSSGAAAATYFTDHPISLGALSGAQFAGGIADIHAELMVTDTHGGFTGGLVISA